VLAKNIFVSNVQGNGILLKREANEQETRFKAKSVDHTVRNQPCETETYYSSSLISNKTFRILPLVLMAYL
jgi:hypothetical protein